ncbi:MAG: hypothetical protein AAGE43_05350 [Pseudomonadota bacterium]
MQELRKLILAILLVALPGLADQARAQNADLAPMQKMDGVIQDLDFASNSMVFEGVRIHMAPDLVVEIRGSYGAFTMLQKGMKAVVTYRVVSESHREAVRIEQLPDNVEIEGA